METSRSLAVLLSVPESHLLSGLECIAAQHQQEIHPAFLVYGSMEFEAFAEVEKARNGQPLEILIYASDAAGDRPLNPEVTWKGIYLGVEAASGGGRYRGKGGSSSGGECERSQGFGVVLEGVGFEKAVGGNADRSFAGVEEEDVVARTVSAGQADAD